MCSKVLDERRGNDENEIEVTRKIKYKQTFL